MSIITKVRDTRFGRKPRNAVEALRQARELLATEPKRWRKGYEFGFGKDGGIPVKKFNPDAPLCGNWGVCSIGAVGLVTDGLQFCEAEFESSREVYAQMVYSSPLVNQAISLLDEVSDDSIVEFNDREGVKRKDVLKQFDKAIALATEKANAQRGKRAAATKRSRKAVTA